MQWTPLKNLSNCTEEPAKKKKKIVCLYVLINKVSIFLVKALVLDLDLVMFTTRVYKLNTPLALESISSAFLKCLQIIGSLF